MDLLSYDEGVRHGIAIGIAAAQGIVQSASNPDSRASAQVVINTLQKHRDRYYPPTLKVAEQAKAVAS